MMRKKREKYGLVTLRVRTREKGLMKAEMDEVEVELDFYLFFIFYLYNIEILL